MTGSAVSVADGVNYDVSVVIATDRSGRSANGRRERPDPVWCRTNWNKQQMLQINATTERPYEDHRRLAHFDEPPIESL